MNKRTVVQFNVKIPETLIELMDKDIEETGEYRNRSEWALAAIRQFLDYRTKIISERKKAFGIEENEIKEESKNISQTAQDKKKKICT